MSALWVGERAGANDERVLVPMTTTHLDAVMAVEAAAYAFPWTRGNFIDSLAAGYPARVLIGAHRQLLGYFIAMPGVDEMHLLNITVAPAEQGRGHARRMIDALIPLCREHAARELWLEVRDSNERARVMYLRLGFTAVGVRKGYYPAPFGRREDAVVMSLKIDTAAQGANDALE
ncbi:MAG: ribosomal protein S18-alanine N-acetyltransferase [Burkholderiales bacterium]|nr:ribosomal protein S18-alanine N-acetyltransferase [Burkholderiales bacterium]